MADSAFHFLRACCSVGEGEAELHPFFFFSLTHTKCENCSAVTSDMIIRHCKFVSWCFRHVLIHLTCFSLLMSGMQSGQQFDC